METKMHGEGLETVLRGSRGNSFYQEAPGGHCEMSEMSGN